MLDPQRYSINYVHDCLLKDNINPPSRDRAQKFYDLLEALKMARDGGGKEGAQSAWNVLRRAEPQLNNRKKLWNVHDLRYLKAPEYALPQCEDGQHPFYAVYLKGLNVIYGKPGSCKTFIAMDFLNRVALAHPDKHVVFAAGEGVVDLYARQLAWEKHNNAKITNLHIYDEALPVLVPDAIEEFKAWTADINPSFIVIDTLARAMLGENENDTAIMGKFITECDKLMRELDCGLLLVHHTNRMGYLRGSIALDGGADSILKVHAEDDTYIVYNSLDNGGKNKYSIEAPAVHLRKIPVTLKGMNDNAVMMLSNRVLDEISEEKPLSDNQLNICRAMLGQDYMTVKGIAENSDISRATIYRNIKLLMDADYVTQPFAEAYKLADKGETYLENI